MKIKIPSVIKIVSRGSVAFAYAVMAWLVVYGLVRVFIGTATAEMAQDFAFVAGLITFIGLCVWSVPWGAPAEH